MDKLNLKFILKGTEIRPAETILQKKSKVEGITPPHVDLLYSYGNQDHVVLVEEQRQKSREQNREWINRPTQMCLTDFCQICKAI